MAANQNRVDLNEHGWWILERRELFIGPSAVVSRVPLEQSDQEIEQGLIDGSRSLFGATVCAADGYTASTASETARNFCGGS